MAIIFPNHKPIKEYEFREDKVFISLKDLDLDKIKAITFHYEILSLKTRKILLTGNLNLAEDINSNQELSKVIEIKSNLEKSVFCKKEYPFLEDRDITYEEASKNIKEFCRKKYSDSVTSILDYNKFKSCIFEIKECYEVTRN